MNRRINIALASVLALLLMIPSGASAQGVLAKAFGRRAAGTAARKGAAARAFSNVRLGTNSMSNGRIALRQGSLPSVWRGGAMPKLRLRGAKASGDGASRVVLRGSRNPKTAVGLARGIKAHKELRLRLALKSMLRAKAKPGKGWRTGVRFKNKKTGKTVIPDAVTSRGRPIELKPNTPSGRRLGRKQLAAQERATGKKGRVIYY